MIPKLRFPAFEDDYIKETLGSVSKDISYGVGAAAKPYDSLYRYLRITDIDEGSFTNLNRGNSVSPNCTKEEGKEYILSKGDFVLARTGASVGKIFLNTRYDNLVYAGFLIRFKINNKALPYYLTTSLQTQRYHKWVSIMSVRSGQPGINAKEYSRYSLNLPSLQEQEKVLSLFKSFDQKINLLTKKKEALETYKRGLMQKIFSQELRFKRKDGTDYPEWTSTKIGNHTFKVSEKNKNLEPLPIYSISNKGGFVPQSEQFEGIDSSERGYDISMYKIVGKDTFAYNPARINVGSYGYSANLDRVQVSSLYVCFKVKPELSPIYLLYFMSSFKFNKSVLRNVEGGVRQYLFYDNFKNIGIPLPSLIEQEKIIQALKLLDGNLGCLDNAINKTQELKKGLLQQMFA